MSTVEYSEQRILVHDEYTICKYGIIENTTRNTFSRLGLLCQVCKVAHLVENAHERREL